MEDTFPSARSVPLVGLIRNLFMSLVTGSLKFHLAVTGLVLCSRRNIFRDRPIITRSKSINSSDIVTSGRQMLAERTNCTVGAPNPPLFNSIGTTVFFRPNLPPSFVSNVTATSTPIIGGNFSIFSGSMLNPLPCMAFLSKVQVKDSRFVALNILKTFFLFKPGGCDDALVFMFMVSGLEEVSALVWWGLVSVCGWWGTCCARTGDDIPEVAHIDG